MTCYTKWKAGALALGALAGVTCHAAIGIENLGTLPPPGSIGGYAMSPFGNDPRPESIVSTFALGAAHTLQFNSEVELNTVGSLWNTWSHGYSGSVYYTIDSTGWVYHSLTIDLPACTKAFSFYLEPNLKFPFDFTIVAEDSSGMVGTMLTVDGQAGAQGIGFYTDEVLERIIILQPTEESDGFAVGEFAIHCIPEPQLGAGLFALGLAGFAAFRRFRRN